MNSVKIDCASQVFSVNLSGSEEIRSLELPVWQEALYWAVFQKYDFAPHQPFQWPDGCNRLQPLLVDGLDSLARGGMQLLLDLESEAGFLCLLPVCTCQSVAWFESVDGQLTLKAGSLGEARPRGAVEVLATGHGATAAEACRAAWEQALRSSGVSRSTRWRHEKRYPEAFRYLGWCSWEQFRKRISADTFFESLDGIEQSPLPVRWALLDDGHLDDEQQQLVSLAGNGKFQGHWEGIRARHSQKLRWLGLWLNMNGYWSGIAPDHHMETLAEHLESLPDPENPGLCDRAYAVVKEGREHARAFFDAMIRDAGSKGFDFIKVDNQAKKLAFLQGHGNAAARAAAEAQALEESAGHHMDGLINCMAHNQVCAFNTRSSAVTRCSEDYLLNDAGRARRHLYNSYGNMLYFGWTVWGDHDMFHSSDPTSARMMAVSKALSGGPVYLSDAPADFVEDHILPLCFSDGSLLRPLAPAAPLPDSIFLDPYAEPRAFRVAAPLPGGAAAVCLYNLTEPEQPVQGKVSPEDLREARALILPPEPAPQHDGVVLYDWHSGEAQLLKADISVDLPAFSDRLFLLCPLRHIWAVIGDTAKFLSPCAVEILEQSSERLMLRAREDCEILVWCSRPQHVSSQDALITRRPDSLLSLSAKAHRPFTLNA